MRAMVLALAMAALPALAPAQTQAPAQNGQAPNPPAHIEPAAPHPPAHAATSPASNVSLLHTIEPANALERAFVTAASDETARAAFRRLFLESQVALATVASGPGAAARTIPLGPGGQSCLIFSSNARATQVMGAQSPRLMMTWRPSLERIRGAPLVIITINLQPYLTLDAPGIEGFLAVASGEAAPAAPHASAGPSQ